MLAVTLLLSALTTGVVDDAPRTAPLAEPAAAVVEPTGDEAEEVVLFSCPATLGFQLAAGVLVTALAAVGATAVELLVLPPLSAALLGAVPGILALAALTLGVGVAETAMCVGAGAGAAAAETLVGNLFGGDVGYLAPVAAGVAVGLASLPVFLARDSLVFVSALFPPDPTDPTTSGPPGGSALGSVTGVTGLLLLGLCVALPVVPLAVYFLEAQREARPARSDTAGHPPPAARRRTAMAY